MAYEIPGSAPATFVAGEDFTASEKRFVTLNAEREAVKPTAGGRVRGVRQNAAAVGRGVAVYDNGTSIVETGGAIALGAKVMTDAQGRAVAHTADNVAVGTAEESAPAASLYISVRLTPVA